MLVKLKFQEKNLCLENGVVTRESRLIGESSLPGPAVQYLDDVVEAVYRVFGIAAGKEETDRAGG